MPFGLFATLGLDQRAFAAGLTQAKGKVNEFAGSVKGQIAAAFGTAAIAGYARSISSAVGRIKDLAEQSSASTDDVQKLDVTLKQSGLQFEDLGASIRKVGQAREEARQGNFRLLETFEKYGVTLADLDNPQLRHIDILQRIARKAGEMTITQREQSEITSLLGEKSAKLVEALTKLSDFDGIKLFKQEDIEKIDAAIKKLEELHRKLLIFGAETVTAVPELKGRDFFTAMLTPGALEFFGIDSTADTSKNVGPLTKAEIEAANVKKRARLARAVAEPKTFDDRPFFGPGTPDAVAPKQRRGPGPGNAGESFVQDSLARIGGFTGNAGRTESLLERAASAAEETAKNTGDLARGGEF